MLEEGEGGFLMLLQFEREKSVRNKKEFGIVSSSVLTKSLQTAHCWIDLSQRSKRKSQNLNQHPQSTCHSHWLTFGVVGAGSVIVVEMHVFLQ